MATTLNGLANVLQHQKLYREAEAALNQAIAINTKALGPDHSSVGVSLDTHGGILVDQGQYKLAQPYYERALRIFTIASAQGKEHPFVANALMGLGTCELETGKPDQALPLLERALALSTAKPSDPLDTAAIQFLLARALVASSRERRRALDLAQLAHEAYVQAGPAEKTHLGQVDVWLRRNNSSASIPRTRL